MTISYTPKKKRFEIGTFVNFVYELDIQKHNQNADDFRKIARFQEKSVMAFLNEAFKYEEYRKYHSLETDIPPFFKMTLGNSRDLATQYDMCRTELWDSETEEDVPIIRI